MGLTTDTAEEKIKELEDMVREAIQNKTENRPPPPKKSEQYIKSSKARNAGKKVSKQNQHTSSAKCSKPLINRKS